MRSFAYDKGAAHLCHGFQRAPDLHFDPASLHVEIHTDPIGIFWDAVLVDDALLAVQAREAKLLRFTKSAFVDEVGETLPQTV
jgi:hypothetical protein